MDILKDVIYQQNLELLKRISNDMFIDDEEKENFIKKYHKKNFAILIPIRKDDTERNLRNIGAKCLPVSFSDNWYLPFLDFLAFIQIFKKLYLRVFQKIKDYM